MGFAFVPEVIQKAPDISWVPPNPLDLVKRENPEELIAQSILPSIAKQLAQLSAQISQVTQVANGRSFVASSERPEVGQGAVQSGTDAVSLLEQRIAKLEQASQTR